MYFLIYVSQASRPMSPAELEEILRKSRDYNARDQITGLLIYKFTPEAHRGNFMQLLEGQRTKVRAAFERICADPRHHTKVLLEDGETESRSFPDWSMGFRNVDEAAFATSDGFADVGSVDFFDRARAGEVSGALAIMKSFYHDGGADD